MLVVGELLEMKYGLGIVSRLYERDDISRTESHSAIDDFTLVWVKTMKKVSFDGVYIPTYVQALHFLYL